MLNFFRKRQVRISKNNDSFYSWCGNGRTSFHQMTFNDQNLSFGMNLTKDPECVKVKINWPDIIEFLQTIKFYT